jgi:hypothetical protein
MTLNPTPDFIIEIREFSEMKQCVKKQAFVLHCELVFEEQAEGNYESMAVTIFYLKKIIFFQRLPQFCQNCIYFVQHLRYL